MEDYYTTNRTIINMRENGRREIEKETNSIKQEGRRKLKKKKKNGDAKWTMQTKATMLWFPYPTSERGGTNPACCLCIREHGFSNRWPGSYVVWPSLHSPISLG